MKGIAAAALLLVSFLAAAQDYPKAEVFGGYSYAHIDTQGVSGSTLDITCNLLIPGFCPAGTFGVHKNFNGWNAAVRANVNRWFGVEADFSGHYRKPLTLSSDGQAFVQALGVTGFPPAARSHSFLFGPAFTYRHPRATPFAHALFGANHVSIETIGAGALSGLVIPGIGTIPSSIDFSDTAFAMALGGGVDVKVNDRISIRAVQADYLFTKHDFSGGFPGIDTHQDNIRISAGVVFTLGGRKAAPAAAASAPPANAVDIPALGVSAIPGDRGLEVVSVQPASPAARAGIRSGDFVIAIDGKLVRTPEEVRNAVAANTSGTAQITYLIHGQWQTERVVSLK